MNPMMWFRSEEGVLIFDSDPEFREFIVRTLASDGWLRIVGMCGTPVEVVQLTMELHPTVVVVGPNLVDLSAGEFCRWVRALPWRMRVVVVSDNEKEEGIRACEEAGASGYVLREEVSRRLARIVAGTPRWGRSYWPEGFLPNGPKVVY